MLAINNCVQYCLLTYTLPLISTPNGLDYLDLTSSHTRLAQAYLAVVNIIPFSPISSCILQGKRPSVGSPFPVLSNWEVLVSLVSRLWKLKNASHADAYYPLKNLLNFIKTKYSNTFSDSLL